MSATSSPVTGVDFVGLPTREFDAAVAFYGETLGLPRSAYNAERHLAEFDTGTVTFSLYMPEEMGMDFEPNKNAVALQVDDVAEARGTLEERGVTFFGDTFDTGVCHMGFFADPDGNALMLHHRYAPRD
jgi:predicted enzyme related to lactoylglutathione lyase